MPNNNQKPNNNTKAPTNAFEVHEETRQKGGVYSMEEALRQRQAAETERLRNEQKLRDLATEDVVRKQEQKVQADRAQQKKDDEHLRVTGQKTDFKTEYERNDALRAKQLEFEQQQEAKRVRKAAQQAYQEGAAKEEAYSAHGRFHSGTQTSGVHTADSMRSSVQSSAKYTEAAQAKHFHDELNKRQDIRETQALWEAERTEQEKQRIAIAMGEKKDAPVSMAENKGFTSSSIPVGSGGGKVGGERGPLFSYAASPRVTSLLKSIPKEAVRQAENNTEIGKFAKYATAAAAPFTATAASMTYAALATMQKSSSYARALGLSSGAKKELLRNLSGDTKKAILQTLGWDAQHIKGMTGREIEDALSRLSPAQLNAAISELSVGDMQSAVNAYAQKTGKWGNAKGKIGWNRSIYSTNVLRSMRKINQLKGAEKIGDSGAELLEFALHNRSANRFSKMALKKFKSIFKRPKGAIEKFLYMTDTFKGYGIFKQIYNAVRATIRSAQRILLRTGKNFEKLGTLISKARVALAKKTVANAKASAQSVARASNFLTRHAEKEALKAAKAGKGLRNNIKRRMNPIRRFTSLPTRLLGSAFHRIKTSLEATRVVKQLSQFAVVRAASAAFKVIGGIISGIGAVIGIALVIIGVVLVFAILSSIIDLTGSMEFEMDAENSAVANAVELINEAQMQFNEQLMRAQGMYDNYEQSYAPAVINLDYYNYTGDDSIYMEDDDAASVNYSQAKPQNTQSNVKLNIDFVKNTYNTTLSPSKAGGLSSSKTVKTAGAGIVAAKMVSDYLGEPMAINDVLNWAKKKEYFNGTTMTSAFFESGLQSHGFPAAKKITRMSDIVTAAKDKRPIIVKIDPSNSSSLKSDYIVVSGIKYVDNVPTFSVLDPRTGKVTLSYGELENRMVAALQDDGGAYYFNTKSHETSSGVKGKKATLMSRVEHTRKYLSDESIVEIETSGGEEEESESEQDDRADLNLNNGPEILTMAHVAFGYDLASANATGELEQYIKKLHRASHKKDVVVEHYECETQDCAVEYIEQEPIVETRMVPTHATPEDREAGVPLAQFEEVIVEQPPLEHYYCAGHKDAYATITTLFFDEIFNVELKGGYGWGEIEIPEEYEGKPVGWIFTCTHNYGGRGWMYDCARVHAAWVAAGSVYQDNAAMIEDKILVACAAESFGPGPGIPAQVGDWVTFYLEDGTAIEAIIADTKSQKDSTYTPWGHDHEGHIDVIEVETNLLLNPGNPGCLEWWRGHRVSSATNNGPYI